MSVLQFFGVALGVFIGYLLYTEGVSGEPCIVKISANPFINKVTASPVGCFKDPDNLKEVLGNFTNKTKWANTNEVVKRCAKLARAKDYERFALGKNGLCLSEADMKQKYHISGTDGASCKDGIGMENSIFVYSLARLPNLQPLGCYGDKNGDRALPDRYTNLRDQIIWTKMELIVNQCAQVAHEKGYEYFAVQYYGECHGGKDGGKSFDKHGKSTKCWQFDKHLGFGVGREWANFVYRIKQDT